MRSFRFCFYSSSSLLGQIDVTQGSTQDLRFHNKKVILTQNMHACISQQHKMQSAPTHSLSCLHVHCTTLTSDSPVCRKKQTSIYISYAHTISSFLWNLLQFVFWSSSEDIVLRHDRVFERFLLFNRIIIARWTFARNEFSGEVIRVWSCARQTMIAETMMWFFASFCQPTR